MEWKAIRRDPPPGDKEFLAYDPVSDRFDVCEVEKDGRTVASTQRDSEWGPLPDQFKPERATHWAPVSRPPGF